VEFDAVVLAGGRAARLGGADKAALEVDGVAMLDRSLTAVATARRVVVVGDERPTTHPVLWVREHPPYGGPVAATYAGLDVLTRGTPVQLTGESGPETRQSHGSTPSGGLVVVLAVDMPGVTEGTVRRLIEGVVAAGENDAYDGAVLSEGGQRHLAMVVRAGALERVRPESVEGVAMRRLWEALDLVDVPASPEEANDVDSWADITRTPRSSGG
jgi:molybdopterin-guanine dinucleotide biosynthesis protein A